RIAKDCGARLYDAFHLNFTSTIPRPLMESLAESTLESDSVSLISKVYDQYMHFVSLEEQLFTFNQPDSYVAFNSSKVSDSQAEANIDAVVESLFSVLITMQQVPIIRCPRNTAASMVAAKLNTRLKEHLLKRGTLLDSPSSSFVRPVLILLDRNVDLTVMCHHTWTYQALIHDLLDFKLNSVRVDVDTEREDGSKHSEPKTYDLDQSDSFWAENAGNPMPDVAANIQSKLKEYTSVLNEVNRLKGDGLDHSGDVLLRTKDLGSLVSEIPELQEKKRCIDMHTNIASALFDIIKSRRLDNFFSLEEAIMTASASSQDRREILSLVQQPLKQEELSSLEASKAQALKIAAAEDKLRLFLIYYMSQNNMPAEEIERFEAALTDSGTDLHAIQYLKKMRLIFDTNLFHPTTASSKGGKSAPGSSGSGLMRQGYNSVANLFQLGVSQMKMLIPTTKRLYLTRIVDAIMEMKQDLGVEDYEYYDPKATLASAGGGASFSPSSLQSGSQVPRKNTPFKQAIVFVIGGGNYIEYQNLQDYAKKHSSSKHSDAPKQIVYGTTEMLTASQFLHQLSTLGKEELDH
ncbi:Sec1 domain containing protein 1, partial [Balamuthia mandrillaris]